MGERQERLEHRSQMLRDAGFKAEHMVKKCAPGAKDALKRLREEKLRTHTVLQVLCTKSEQNDSLERQLRTECKYARTGYNAWNETYHDLTRRIKKCDVRTVPIRTVGGLGKKSRLKRK